MVRILDRFGQQAVHRRDTAKNEEEFHGNRVDRVQQYGEHMRMAVGGVFGLLLVEESATVSEQKGARARWRYELFGGGARRKVLRPEGNRAHGRERDQREQRATNRV